MTKAQRTHSQIYIRSYERVGQTEPQRERETKRE